MSNDDNTLPINPAAANKAEDARINDELVIGCRQNLARRINSALIFTGHDPDNHDAIITTIIRTLAGEGTFPGSTDTAHDWIKEAMARRIETAALVDSNNKLNAQLDNMHHHLGKSKDHLLTAIKERDEAQHKAGNYASEIVAMREAIHGHQQLIDKHADTINQLRADLRRERDAAELLAQLANDPAQAQAAITRATQTPHRITPDDGEQGFTTLHEAEQARDCQLARAAHSRGHGTQYVVWYPDNPQAGLFELPSLKEAQRVSGMDSGSTLADDIASEMALCYALGARMIPEQHLHWTSPEDEYTD